MKALHQANKAHKPNAAQQFRARGGLTPRYCLLCRQERGTVGGKFIKHYNNQKGGAVCENSGKRAPSANGGGLFRETE